MINKATMSALGFGLGGFGDAFGGIGGHRH